MDFVLILPIILAILIAFGLLSGSSTMLKLGVKVDVVEYKPPTVLARIALAFVLAGTVTTAANANSFWQVKPPPLKQVIALSGVSEPSVVQVSDESLMWALKTKYLVTCNKDNYAANKLSRQPSGLVVELVSDQVVTLPNTCTVSEPKVNQYQFIVVK